MNLSVAHAARAGRNRLLGLQRRGGASTLATYQPGDHVRYIGQTVLDVIIETGDVGIVTEVANGWVYAYWPRAGVVGIPTLLLQPGRVGDEPSGDRRHFNSRSIPHIAGLGRY